MGLFGKKKNARALSTPAKIAVTCNSIPTHKNAVFWFDAVLNGKKIGKLDQNGIPIFAETDTSVNKLELCIVIKQNNGHITEYGPRKKVIEVDDGQKVSVVFENRKFNVSFSEKDYDYACSKNTAQSKNSGAAPKSILDKYREGLVYLESCTLFGETEFREFNRIIGERFSEADIQTQLANSKMMIAGMDELKGILKQNMIESIKTFEKLEQSGIDLSQYNI